MIRIVGIKLKIRFKKGMETYDIISKIKDDLTNLLLKFEDNNARIKRDILALIEISEVKDKRKNKDHPHLEKFYEHFIPKQPIVERSKKLKHDIK